MRRLRPALLMVIVPLAAALGLLYLATSPSLAQSADSVMSTLSPLTEEEAARILDGIRRIEASAVQVQASAQLTEVHLMPDYRTVPDVVPRVIITRSGEDLGEGYYFVAPLAQSGSTLLIVNDRAQLVYYYHEPNNLYDFKRQPDGSLSFFSNSLGGFKVFDSSYALINTWFADNGYTTDVHDLQILPNGHALLLIYAYRPVDLSAYGGHADAQVVDLVVQELDTDHNVVFEWNSRDHFMITDTYVSLTTAVVDYVHGNAVELDVDGNLLISSRHLSEITKIDRSTGEIIWRLGGKHNQFTFSGDQALPGEPGVYFSFQHDIRRLPNGHITLFDNGNQFIEAGIRGSRGVEYEIDEVTKTITRVQEFRTAPETYSVFMGNVQRLPDGNTVIGWGGGLTQPSRPPSAALTEFTPEGDAALHLSFYEPDGPSILNYRAFKFPWQGIPATTPTLIADTDSVPVTLYYSWNGATEVASYQVKGGLTPTGLETIAHQPKTDFEDSTPISDTSSSLCFFQVIPISKQGEPMRASNILYLGDSACATGLTADGALTATRVFTDVQATGLVTTTLTVLPGETTSPTLFVRTPLAAVDLAAIPAEPIESNVRFKLQAFAGEGWSELSVFTLPVQLTIEYGALDLSRNPADVMLRRWEEAQQTWSEEGVVLLERDVVKRRATYALDRPGEFALFVVNHAPESAPVSILIDEDQPFAFSGSLFPYFDPDEDEFAGIVIESLPVSGSLTYAGAVITPSLFITPELLPSLVFTPAADQFGLPYTSFSYKVSDGFAESPPYTLTISVRPINDAPVANDDQAVLSASAASTEAADARVTVRIPVLANDYDVDGDLLRIVSHTEPVYGSVTIDGDLMVYTGPMSLEGVDTFSYTVTDGQGGQATATVMILPDQNREDRQYFPLLYK